MKIKKTPRTSYPIYNLCGDGKFSYYKAWKRLARYWRKKYVKQLKEQMEIKQ
jgi:hypothetical protein